MKRKREASASSLTIIREPQNDDIEESHTSHAEPGVFNTSCSTSMPVLPPHEVIDVARTGESFAEQLPRQRAENSVSHPAGNEFKQPENLNPRSTSKFLWTPFTAIWTRLKWSVILSIGRSESMSILRKDDIKAAVATTLEVAIMGSALVLTLCLQIQEVVGSRGGFTLRDRAVARIIFVLSSALSFSLAFYSIITSAVMLLSIHAVPSSVADEFLLKLSSWSAIPRLCALAGAFSLGIAALTAFFLGLEDSAAWVGAIVVTLAMVLTIMSTTIILRRVRRLQSKILERAQPEMTANAMEGKADVENQHNLQKKDSQVNCSGMESPVSQPVLTPLSSLTNTTGFSIRASRLRA